MKGIKAPREPKDQRGDRSMRGLALGLVALAVIVIGYGLFVTVRPIYWKIYAELSHEPAPVANEELNEKLVQALLKDVDKQVQTSLAGRKELPEKKNTGIQPGAQPAEQAAGAAAAATSTQQQQEQQQQQQGGETPQPDQAELEKQKEDARMRQWEDVWEKSYKESEAKKKVESDKDRKAREEALIKRYNYTLTKEAIKPLAQNNMLMVSWANHHYTQFALTWVYHVQKLNITGYIMGAMDDEILTILAKRRINTFSMKAGLTTGDFGWGSKTFAKMGRKKINLVAMFLKLDVQVIISDVDVMWLRDPMPFLLKYPDADILTSSDHLVSTVGKEEQLEKYPDSGSAFNIGIMLFRNKSLPFVEKWIQKIEADDTIWDQNAFNDMSRDGQVLDANDPNHYFLGYQGTLKIGVLPVAFFSSGHVYFTQHMDQTFNITPYAVHATFQFSGTAGKRHRFREALLWLDGADYFRPKGGFISYDPQIPKELLDNGGPQTNKMDINNTIGHFNLVNYQLKQMRQGLALATILNRTLILPELWCGMDRYWAPHSGTLPGSEFKLPFKCPADHVLALENGWTREWNVDEYGPHIDFREHSFLKNPDLPESVLSSAVYITPCKKGQASCADGSVPATVEQNKVFLQENLDSEKIKMALSSVGSISLIRFTSVTGAFGNFTEPKDYTKFYNRVQHYGCIWCCVNAHPGHIHYDFWWDVPHTDRAGRKWDKWVPVTGP